MVNVMTANVAAIRVGTNWTIDVTAANLDADLFTKDFIVLHNGALVANTDYTKTTRTVLTYTGVALPPSTGIEVRRKTTVDPITTVSYGNRFSSALWNAEVERRARWQAEVDLNGSGLSGIGLPLPDNAPFGVTWLPDTLRPPTRQAVYNRLVITPTLSSAPFTVNPTVPNIGSITSNSDVPNTKYISDFYAPLASPALTGNPVAPTRPDGDNTVSIATTQFVQTAINRGFQRFTVAISTRAAAVITTGDFLINQSVTLARANPAKIRVTVSGLRPVVGATPWGIGYYLSINSSEVIRNFFYSASAVVLADPILEAYVLPLALAAGSHTVAIQFRVNPTGSTLAWTGCTALIEFEW